MFKDLTLGQFFPGDSFVHRLDPRTKICLSLIFIVLVFLANSILGFALLVLFILLVAIITKIPLKFMIRGLKTIMFFIVLTAFFNLFLSTGTVIWQWRFLKITDRGLELALTMIARLVLLIFGTSILTLTTSPIALTDGIEALLRPFKKIKLPVHELAMMMTIALRFIPTLIDETDKIIKAQTARGTDFESGNLIRRAKALIPILIPLFISSFRRADDLALAMECRCYNGGENRTRMKVLEMKAIDFVGWGVTLALGVIVIILNYVRI